jgi:hypothetical protein
MHGGRNRWAPSVTVGSRTSHTTPTVSLSTPAGMLVAVSLSYRADFNPWEGFYWFALPVAAPVPRVGDGFKDSSGTAYPMASAAELAVGDATISEINGYGFYLIHSDPMLRGLPGEDYRLFRSQSPIWGGDESFGPFVLTP